MHHRKLVWIVCIHKEMAYNMNFFFIVDISQKSLLNTAMTYRCSSQLPSIILLLQNTLDIEQQMVS